MDIGAELNYVLWSEYQMQLNISTVYAIQMAIAIIILYFCLQFGSNFMTFIKVRNKFY